MHSLLEDLSTLTTVGHVYYKQLASKVVSIISHHVAESIRDREQVTVIDTGIGELRITNVEDEVMYKFIPAPKLDRAVKKTYLTGQSQLTTDIDNALSERITKTYKDLF